MQLPTTNTNAWGTVTTHVFRHVMWGNIPAMYVEITGSVEAYFGNGDDIEILQQSERDGRMVFIYADTHPVLVETAAQLAKLGAWVEE